MLRKWLCVGVNGPDGGAVRFCAETGYAAGREGVTARPGIVVFHTPPAFVGIRSPRQSAETIEMKGAEV